MPKFEVVSEYKPSGDQPQAIAALAEGMTPEEAAGRLKGITCGRRNTSCPDQLAVALEDYLKGQ